LPSPHPAYRWAAHYIYVYIYIYVYTYIYIYTFIYSGCVCGGVPLRTVPALSWCGEVSLGGLTPNPVLVWGGVSRSILIIISLSIYTHTHTHLAKQDSRRRLIQRTVGLRLDVVLEVGALDTERGGGRQIQNMTEGLV